MDLRSPHLGRPTGLTLAFDLSLPHRRGDGDLDAPARHLRRLPELPPPRPPGKGSRHPRRYFWWPSDSWIGGRREHGCEPSRGGPYPRGTYTPVRRIRAPAGPVAH